MVQLYKQISQKSYGKQLQSGKHQQHSQLTQRPVAYRLYQNPKYCQKYSDNHSKDTAQQAETAEQIHRLLLITHEEKHCHRIQQAVQIPFKSVF